jgi:hypothetical protein
VTSSWVRSSDEHRDDGNVAGERDLDLEAHEVGRVVNPAPPVRAALEPLRPNKCKKDVGRADGRLDDFFEVDAWLDRVDFDDYFVLAVARPQFNQEPPRRTQGIASPVVEEHFWHAAEPRPQSTLIPSIPRVNACIVRVDRDGIVDTSTSHSPAGTVREQTSSNGSAQRCGPQSRNRGA